MNSYFVLLLIVLIIIIITYIEYKLTRNKIKFNVKVPKKYVMFDYNNTNYILYNKKHKPELNKLLNKSNLIYYKIKPQITIPQRIKIILDNKHNFVKFNLNNIISLIVPIVVNMFDILTINIESKYRLLTTNPNDYATTDNKYVYVS
jgi:hypothetical protein